MGRTLFAPRTLVVAGLIVVAALSRLLPHPPNFSPIEATALFAGAYLVDRRLAIAVPLAAMVLSDLFLGFHAGMPVVYGAMAVMALAGRGLADKRTSVAWIAGYGLASAVFFFVVTNFFVWATQGMYPMSLDGLVACYVAALPFFQNSLAGVAVYSTLLFGGFALVERRSWATA